MADVGSLWVKLGLNDSQYNKGLDKAQGKTKGFAKQVSGLGPLIGTAMAVGAVTRLGKEIFTLTAGFGSMMSRVQALSGATDDMTDTLRDQAKVLGKQTQFTATEAAEAMTFLAQAGLEVDQIYAAMPASLELAAAGQLQLAEAADISTNIMSAYGLQAEDLGRVNDIIANTATNANTNVREFAEAFKMVGPIAKSANQGIEDVSAAIGLLANSGIKGTMAGTALRTMMSKLIKPTGDAADILNRFGIETIDATTGNLRRLNDILADMQKAGLSTADMFTIFDLRAAGAATVLKNASGTFDEFADKVGVSGTAARIAAKQMDNLKGDALKLKSAWQGMLLELGENSEGIFRKTTQLLTGLANAIGSIFAGKEGEIKGSIGLMVKGFDDLTKGERASEIQKMTTRIGDLNTEIGDLNKIVKEGEELPWWGNNQKANAAQKRVEKLDKELAILQGTLDRLSGGKGKAVTAAPAAAAPSGGAAPQSDFDPIKFFVKDSAEELDKEWDAMLSGFEIFPQSWLGDQAAKLGDTFAPILDEALIETDFWASVMIERQGEVNAGWVTMANVIGGVVNGMSNARGNWAALSATILTGIVKMVPLIRTVVVATKALFVAKQAEAIAGATASGSAVPFPGNLIAIGASVAAVLAATIPFVGSFATGIDNVPFDGLAMIHQGEAVIPAHENKRGGAGGGQLSVSIGVDELRFILDEDARKTENSF